MSQKEVVDVSITQNGRGIGNELPLELIDTIVENNTDDKDSLLASSCVSKSWRAASLRHLFSTAVFSSEGDFMRWRDIGSHLPQVPLFVKKVEFEPGAHSNVGPILSLNNQYPDDALMHLTRPDTVYSSSPSCFQLPDMPQARKLIWDTPFSHPIYCTVSTQQFLSTFCSLKEVELWGSFATISDAKRILELFPRIEILDIRGIDIDDAGFSGPSPAFAGDMTNLRRLSVEECETPLDWLVNDILAVSHPTNLQSIHYEDNSSFSQKAFTRLVALSAESLEELTIQSPYYEVTPRGAWTNPPHFTNRSFPSLTSLTFGINQLGFTLGPSTSMTWCRKAIEVLPPAPKLTSLTMRIYAEEPEGVDDIMANQSFDWKQLSELTSELFPELKRFIVHVSMETEFGARRKALSEALLKERLERFGKKLKIEWVNENPAWDGNVD
ncbi:uncharacterized protein EV420DRAFT_217349 [Desarmillaria tabescens]|uniref:F-box domain-containing protein n=1 Tax=Armillaria tabescens TaxID=1929756 RepID=A0AA39N7Q6_ARMTA|nr:uncharacterized protein EV420DRAFT_217349 [Desarmillaria tabescens]KAK0460563.1 hypothetical protein EV420DRAFT_217349 [Desarmillaria tabescens]